MMFRIVSTAIIAFWLVMTGLLVRLIWFPESSKQAQVPPRVLYDVLTDSGLPQFLDVWQGREHAGDLNVTCDSLRFGGAKLLRLNWRADLEVKQGVLPEGELIIEGKALIDAEGNINESKLTMLLPQMQLELKIEVPKGADFPAVTLIQNGRVLIESSAGSMDDPGPVMQALLGMAGMTLDDVRKVREEAAQRAQERPVIVKRGRFSVDDRDFQGFVLDVPSGRTGVWRLFFTETGDILGIDTPLDYRIRAESMRPEGFVPPDHLRRGAGPPKKP